MHLADRQARGFKVLTRRDCLRLLERGGVGRIAVPGQSVPTIRPVNFALHDGRIVMRTSDNGLWAAAAAEVDAAFEFDEVRNEDHWTWNVIVTGALYEFTDADGAQGAQVKVWAPSSHEHVLALTITEISGRQVPDPREDVLAIPAARDDGTDLERQPDDAGRGDIDRWGRSERARTVTRAVVEPAYRYWFRFSLENPERIPSHGGALLVANHAGLVPVDAMLVMHAIERDLHRRVYGLHHHALAAVPALGTLLARAGGVVAHPENALRLLRDDGELLLVFPEGTNGTGKLFRDRYRLARFGRGGFVATAMRAGVPVVPLAIVGSEETMPTLARLPGGWPVTLNALMFGPFGAGIHFPGSIIARVLEPVEFDESPGLERYPTDRVTDAAATIQAQIQLAVDEMVAGRRGGRSR